MLIKISEDRFIDLLQTEGHLYLNTINYFRSIEDSGLKGDKNEGKASLKQITNIQIQLEGKTIAQASKGQLYFDHPENQGNIYCMYGIKTNSIDFSKKSFQKIQLENKTKNFGQSALLIFDLKEFMNRLKNELQNKRTEFTFSPVSYYHNDTYNGKLSPFHKSHKYEYQNEVRLWIPNKGDRPIEIFIGDISDISYKIPIEDLDKIEVKVVD